MNDQLKVDVVQCYNHVLCMYTKRLSKFLAALVLLHVYLLTLMSYSLRAPSKVTWMIILACMYQ